MGYKLEKKQRQEENVQKIIKGRKIGERIKIKKKSFPSEFQQALTNLTM